MICDTENPYTVSDFIFENGDCKFSILIDRFKARYRNIEKEIEAIAEKKVERELPADKEVISDIKYFTKDSMMDLHAEAMIVFKYRQLSEAEAADKLEEERIHHFVKQLEKEYTN